MGGPNAPDSAQRNGVHNVGRQGGADQAHASPSPSPTPHFLASSFACRPALEWKKCAYLQDTPLAAIPFACANTTVPLDYTRPNRANITLAVIKLPASSGKPVGTLFLVSPLALGVDVWGTRWMCRSSGTLTSPTPPVPRHRWCAEPRRPWWPRPGRAAGLGRQRLLP